MSIILPYSPIIWEVSRDNPECFDTENMKFEEVLPILTSASSINNVCFGGLLESYLSLSFFEKIHQKYSKLFWVGDNLYYQLVKWQGLANLKSFNKDFLDNYPCPIVNDIDNNIYINSLFNTDDYTQNMWGIYDKPIKYNSYIKRILNNYLIASKPIYPKWRLPIEISDKFKLWLDLNKDIFNKKIILLLPDHMPKYSNHDFINFSWNINEVKSFIALAKTLNMQVIVLSDQVKKYYGNIKFYEFDLESFFFLLEKSVGVISADIDISTISAIHSQNFLLLRKVLNKRHYKYNLIGNKINRKKHVVYREISVENAFKFIKRIDRWKNLAQ